MKRQKKHVLTTFSFRVNFVISISHRCGPKKPQNSPYSPLPPQNPLQQQGYPYIVPVANPVQPQYASQSGPVPMAAKPGTGQQGRGTPQPGDVTQQKPIWPSQTAGVSQSTSEVRTASPASKGESSKHENSDDVTPASKSKASSSGDDKQEDCKTVFELECNDTR